MHKNPEAKIFCYIINLAKKIVQALTDCNTYWIQWVVLDIVIVLKFDTIE